MINVATVTKVRKSEINAFSATRTTSNHKDRTGGGLRAIAVSGTRSLASFIKESSRGVERVPGGIAVELQIPSHLTVEVVTDRKGNLLALGSPQNTYNGWVQVPTRDVEGLLITSATRVGKKILCHHMTINTDGTRRHSYLQTKVPTAVHHYLHLSDGAKVVYDLPETADLRYRWYQWQEAINQHKKEEETKVRAIAEDEEARRQMNLATSLKMKRARMKRPAPPRKSINEGNSGYVQLYSRHLPTGGEVMEGSLEQRHVVHQADRFRRRAEQQDYLSNEEIVDWVIKSLFSQPLCVQSFV